MKQLSYFPENIVIPMTRRFLGLFELYKICKPEKKVRAFLVLLLFGITLPAEAVEETLVTFDTREKSKITVLIGDVPVATLVVDDREIPRPYFCSVKTLENMQVTRNHPPIEGADVPDHPSFHPGLWMAFGDLSGSDYWRNKANVKCTADSVKTFQGGNSGTLQAEFSYLDQAKPSIETCREKFRCTFVVRDQRYFILWDSPFRSWNSIYFGVQEEMGLGVRVATMMRAENRQREEILPGTGRILDSRGRLNGAEVWGEAARWCDYRGDISNKTVGITILCHPKNFRPSWFHARDYGLLVANPFGRRAFKKGEPSKVAIEPGDSLRLRYGIFVYSIPKGAKLDLDGVHDDYLACEKVESE